MGVTVQAQVPVQERIPVQDSGDRTKILFTYQRLGDREKRIIGAIEGENRYDVTRCPLHRAKTAFADHDILVTDRGTLISDRQRQGKRIYRGDELVRHLKEGDRDPGLAVIVLSDIQDPAESKDPIQQEYGSTHPLEDPDRYYLDDIAGHVNEYFRYPFLLDLFLTRLRGYDTNRN